MRITMALCAVWLVGCVPHEPLPAALGAQPAGIVCEGHFVVRTPPDLALLVDCNQITGSLLIGGPPPQIPRGVRGSDAQGRVQRSIALEYSSLFGKLPSAFQDAPPRLFDVDALDGLVVIHGHLAIVDNRSLTNLNGLRRLRSVGGALVVSKNPSLVDLGGLSSVTRIASHLRIEGNESLTSIAGLSKLVELKGGVYIEHNEVLESVDGTNH